MDKQAGKSLSKIIYYISFIFNFLREIMDSFNKSQLEEDDEKVTRETAAYNRLDAVLRVTKPLCEKQIESTDDDDDDEERNLPVKTSKNFFT